MAVEVLPLSPLSLPLIGVGPDFFGMQNSRHGVLSRSMSHCLKFVTAGRERRRKSGEELIMGVSRIHRV